MVLKIKHLAEKWNEEICATVEAKRKEVFRKKSCEQQQLSLDAGDGARNRHHAEDERTSDPKRLIIADN